MTASITNDAVKQVSLDYLLEEKSLKQNDDATFTEQLQAYRFVNNNFRVVIINI